MKNQNNTTKQANAFRLDANTTNTLGAARDGYIDAIAGQGFSSFYEQASRVYQLNYERGRIWAISFKALGDAPKWPRNVKYPRTIERNLTATLRAGNASSIC